ncbi:DUF2169 family type VI secretion system accessory protein [Chondromyces apiculatus]|uniref:DUF2169 domain-containing protein n=1 Tax=Chondromyces apiculatus DSM 436 TaxID=1192034 RepID=A0A017TD35_9BACT|nr:DUF2169 domain-containing protein [Chondromyces apiculatus]EYF06837.1 Hypothetical protein CAP_1534 [Chondromyces apiculatus DSM 436]
MGHPEVDNRTSFALELLFLLDEEGRPLLVPLVQATYAIVPGRGLELAPEQVAPSLTGETWGKDAAVSSYRIEPAFAFIKPATDVVLLGHAHARRATEAYVAFKVGPVGKTLKVVGDRYWVRSGNAITPTRPTPFESIPLTYERAFGGWDRSDPDPAKHTLDARNPVGTGFRVPGGPFEEGVALPNLEDPADPVKTWGQAVTPAGVGFTSPNWQPRAARAGTYDEAWRKERMPLLARDFDRRFFNAASPGLVASGYLRGDEPVSVEGASVMGRLSFRLPGVLPPRCQVSLVNRGDEEVALKLDTVIIDADADRVLLQWRGHTVLRDGPHDVRAVLVERAEQALLRAAVQQPAGSWA